MKQGGIVVWVIKALRYLGWREALGLCALLLLYALHIRSWPVYGLFCAMYFVLRWQVRPAFPTTAYNTLALAVLLLDQKANCCYANPQFCTLAALSQSDALGDGWLAAIHPEDQVSVLAAQISLQQELPSVIEFRLLDQSGRIRWVSSFMHAVAGCTDVAYQMILFDFTEFKQTLIEARVLLEEQRHRSLDLESILNSSKDPIAVLDLQFNFSFFNQAYADLFFALYGIILAKNDCFLLCEFSSADDRSNLITFWGRALQGEYFSTRSELYGESFVSATNVQGKRAALLVFDMSFNPQFNDAGEQVGAVSVLHDVTLSSKTELALLRSKELFKAATQSSLNAIYVLEVIKDESWNVKDFQITDVNPNGFDFFCFKKQKTPDCLLLEALKNINAAHLYPICCEVFLTKKMVMSEEFSLNPFFYGAWFNYQIVAVSNGVVLTIADVSQRKKSDLAMAAYSDLQKAILDSAGSAIIVTDLNNTIRLFNRAAEKMLGYQSHELIAKEKPALFHQSTAAAELLADFCKEIGEEPSEYFDAFAQQAKRYIQRDWIYQHRDGHCFPVELTMNVVRDLRGEITGYMGIANDISIRKLAERKLQQSESRTSAILDSLHDCVLMMGFDGVIRDANPAALKLFAFDQLKGCSLSALFPTLGEINSKRGVAKELFVRLGVDTRRVSEVVAVNKDGLEMVMDMALAVVEVDGERVYIATLHDLTQHKLDEQKMQDTIEELEALQVSLSASHEQLSSANAELSRLAHMDGLTGLANRRLFDQTLAQEWARAARSGARLALVMLDVDYFKRYNDHFGHQAGDECLKQVSAALTAALHRPGDFVARYGGEEFVLVLPNTDQDGAIQVVEMVLNQIRNLQIAHQTSDAAKVVTMSAGIAVMLPLQGVDFYCLVEAADQALYQAKHLGRNRYFVAGNKA